jgi:secreted trypsin-like serine protease
MRPCAQLLRPALALIATVLAVTIAGPAATAATPPPTGRILGGQAAAPTAWPHQAFVQTDLGSGSTAICGGTVIAAGWVVTAAHCVTLPDGTPAAPAAVTVVVGKVQRSAFTSADRRAVDRLERNAAFSTATYADDVAVLHLRTPTDSDQARLPRTQDGSAWAPGQRGTVLGWGRTTNDPSDHGTDLLQQVDVPLVPDATCTGAYGSQYQPATMLCAGGEPGRDTCNGDSGGPLLTGDHVLVGLTSFGPPTCGQANVPAVYTRVGADPVNTWIRDRVPQAEIDISPAAPQPGQTVTLTSASRNPGGAYTSLTWDLDSDGQYDDATGPTTSVTVPEGRTTVGLQAADAAGDRERRRIAIDAVRSPIAFTTAAMTVTEGQPVTLSVAKTGGGTGTVQPVTESATATAGADFPAALPLLTFAPGDTTQTLTVPTVDDATDEPTEAFTVRLGAASSGLSPVAPAAVAVTVLDNDPTPRPSVRVLRVQVTRKAVTVSASTSKAGRFALLVRPSRRTRTLAASHRTVARAGTFTLKARLTKSGRSALRRGKHPVRISVTLTPKGSKGVTKALHLTAPGTRRLVARSAAVSCHNLRAPAALRTALRTAHERAVGSARDGSIAKGSLFYGICGTTRYAIASFGKAPADQPEKFRKRAGASWEDAGDGFEDGCSASARRPVPAALVTAWRTCRRPPAA